MSADCPNPCAQNLKLDLGTGDFRSPPRITGDYSGFTVTWLTTGLAIQHFDFDTGDGGVYTLTPKPMLTLMAGKGVSDPVISGLGERLVVAYERADRTQIRISDDQASSFGPPIVVPGPCTSCANGGPRPMSVAISGANILVEVSLCRWLTTGIRDEWLSHPRQRRDLDKGLNTSRWLPERHHHRSGDLCRGIGTTTSHQSPISTSASRARTCSACTGCHRHLGVNPVKQMRIFWSVAIAGLAAMVFAVAGVRRQTQASSC